MKYNYKLIFITVVTLILCLSFILLKDKEEENFYGEEQITKNEIIGDDTLTVTYQDGNDINIELNYGYNYKKVIKIENKNDKDIIFALRLSDVEISNEELTYTLKYSSDSTNYEVIEKNVSIYGDSILSYNLIVNKNSVSYIQLEILSNHEGSASTLKGSLGITNNISDYELFDKEINIIHQTLLNKINSLNGITIQGRFIINVDELEFDNVANIKGYIIVDSSDITYLKYTYYVYNDKYMMYNVDFTKKKISLIDTVKNDDFNSICSLYNKGECNYFNTIPYNENNTKNEFYKNVHDVYELVKNNVNITEKNVYIIDVNQDISNNTNIHGYILIDNTNDNMEYYLYLTDDIFMVSGYNITKLGDFDINSITVRSYNQTAFNNATSSKKKVCTFTGFNTCYDINNNLL